MKQTVFFARPGPGVPFNIPDGPYSAELMGEFIGVFTLEQFVADRWEVLSEHVSPVVVPGNTEDPALLMWRCHSIDGEASASIEGS